MSRIEDETVHLASRFTGSPRNGTLIYYCVDIPYPKSSEWSMTVQKSETHHTHTFSVAYSKYMSKQEKHTKESY